MNKYAYSLFSLEHIEELTKKDTTIHHLHPIVKLFFTVFFIIFILTSTSYALFSYLFLICLVILICFLAKIPVREMLKRTLIGLPFSFFLGLSNVILMPTPISFYNIPLTIGLLSMISIMLKTFLCLAVVFLFVATTPLEDIAGAFVMLHVPYFLVSIILVTYRYIYLLVEEAGKMHQAYILRHFKKDALEMKHMGSFLGLLFVRSLHHAHLVDDAMSLRGYDPGHYYGPHQSIHAEDVFLIVLMAGVMIILKVVLS
ncbi:cobalt ECF transporter T component CbiQ [uncultured Sharpea sp.]|uniref:cobalt ECF transporter T component CbiQ n=1 Tax=uncultured Sharpea sp. TaxID=1112738 RepID=UPI00258565DB|nr:cobalt ECF transporter T component CbiQ [uncultured Sharpea sp.]